MKQILFILFCMISSASAWCQEVNRYIQKGNEAYRNNDYAEAIAEYQKALAKEPSNSIAKFNLANALQKKDETAASKKNYDEIAAATKEVGLKSHSFYNKALALIKEKKLPDAVEAFKQSLLQDPNDNDTRDNLQKAINELKKQQQSQQQNKQNNKQDKEQKKPQQKINKEMMEQKFKELSNQEKQLQKQLQKKQNNGQPEKDW